MNHWEKNLFEFKSFFVVKKKSKITRDETESNQQIRKCEEKQDRGNN